MAVIDIHTEPSGRTRVLFDFRACADDRDVERIELAMRQCRSGLALAPDVPGPAPGPVEPQAASARRTRRPVTLPSRRRMRAS
jgi:hypothetical protein